MRLLADLGLVLPMVLHCARKTQLIDPVARGNQVIRVLALSPERFLGDLKVLAATGLFKIYLMPRYWQYAGLALHGIDNNLQRQFLERFLRIYLRKIPLDLVIGTSLWYRQDIPWGAAAQRTGLPYVILHKECFKPEPLQKAASAEKALKFGTFMGERLLVHNQPIADALISHGYVSESHVTACGAMRMDAYVKEALSSQGLRSAQRKRPLVTYFSFTLGMGLDDRGIDPFPTDPSQGWFELFRDSHVAFACLARQRPEVDFVIKTKWHGQWTQLIENCVVEAGLVLAKIPNLEIVSVGSAHDLILDSTVVCSFASTTMLEAALAGKPVVVPHFGEVEKPNFRGRVKLLSSYHLFDIADSTVTFKSKIEQRLEEPQVDPTVRERLNELFELWIGPLDGSSLQNYVSELKMVAKREAIT